MSKQKLSVRKNGRIAEREKDEITRVAAGAAIDKVGKDEFLRRVNAAARLIHQTLVSNFADDALGMTIGLIALDHVTESTMQQAKEMISAAITADLEREN